VLAAQKDPQGDWWVPNSNVLYWTDEFGYIVSYDAVFSLYIAAIVWSNPTWEEPNCPTHGWFQYEGGSIFTNSFGVLYLGQAAIAWSKSEPESEFPYAAVYKGDGVLAGYAVVVTGRRNPECLDISEVKDTPIKWECENRLLAIQNLGGFIANMQKHMPEAFQKMKMEKVREYKERLEKAIGIHNIGSQTFERVLIEMEAE